MATVSRRVGEKRQIGRPRERSLCELGLRIEARLERLRLTVDQFATATGINRQTIYDIMSGKTAEPRPSTLRKLAAGLGTTRENLSGDLF